MRHDVADSQTGFQQFAFFKGRQQSAGESRLEQRRPEAIPRPREMMTDCRCVKSGVDAAEENSQIRRDDVGNGLTGGIDQLVFGGFEALGARHAWRLDYHATPESSCLEHALPGAQATLDGRTETDKEEIIGRRALLLCA